MSALPISRGDSFLLLVLCGEALCCSSILTFSTRPASAARVRAVSPSSVCSSRVRSVDVDTATKNTSKSVLKLEIHTLQPSRYSTEVVFYQIADARCSFGSDFAPTLQHRMQDVSLRLRGCCVQRQPAPAVALSEGRHATGQLLQRRHITCGDTTHTGHTGETSVIFME